MEMSAADDAELRDICWHWGTAYVLNYDGERYTATRVNSPDHVLSADTAAQLREMIRSDYFEWLESLRER
ncbi:MAG TPA: hypothetical protein VMA72_06705 [Streptosporangiaceae bacterium]|nr:hypothetical protein [Streptosporangiaceae bacterium]